MGSVGTVTSQPVWAYDGVWPTLGFKSQFAQLCLAPNFMSGAENLGDMQCPNMILLRIVIQRWMTRLSTRRAFS